MTDCTKCVSYEKCLPHMSTGSWKTPDCPDFEMKEVKVQVFKVQMEEGGPALMTKDTLMNSWVWTEAEAGDRFFIEVVEMTQEELSALPEFTGF